MTSGEEGSASISRLEEQNGCVERNVSLSISAFEEANVACA